MLAQARTGLPFDILEMMIDSSVDLIIKPSRFGAPRRITGLLHRRRYINTNRWWRGSPPGAPLPAGARTRYAAGMRSLV